MSAPTHERSGGGAGPRTRAPSRQCELLLFALGALAPLLGTACASHRAASQPRAVAAAVAAQPQEDPIGVARAAFGDLAAKLEEAGKTDPRKVDELWLRGQLNNVLALDPRHKLARFNLAVLEEHNGAADGARDTYADLVAEDGDFYPAAENLARYQVQDGETDRASRVYRTVVARDRRNVTSRLALARLLARGGEHQKAIELCKEALGGKPDSVEAFRVLALSYNSLGNIPMAELAISRGVRAAPDDVELAFVLAQIRIERGEVSDGVGRLRELVAKAPQRLDIRAELASIAIAHRDFGTAVQQYDAIVQQDPSNRAARLGAAVARARIGELEAAERTYQDLLAAEPDAPDVLWNVAVLYHQYLHRPGEALQYYERFKQAAPAGDDGTEEASRRISELRGLVEKPATGQGQKQP